MLATPSSPRRPWEKVSGSLWSEGCRVIRVANAPVSYGVFEMTLGKIPHLPGPDELLDAVVAEGYDGIDLGPLGFLGERSELRARLQSRRLGLAGGWVALRFTNPEGFEEDLAGLDRALDAFDAVGEIGPAWRPKPTLADAGSPERAACPGRGKDLPAIGLDKAGWIRLSAGVQRAAERCRARGFESTFHHHAGTYVESPHEIERLLELTNIGLCLDTGHLLLGGGDPIRALEDWGQRVNHVHLKDARRAVLDGVIADQAGLEAVWRRGAFCELGAGDLDVEGFLAALRARDYSGWLVVEQDRIPRPGERMADAAEAQARNRAFLRARGL
jgi:inosose dehydratase